MKHLCSRSLPVLAALLFLAAAVMFAQNTYIGGGQGYYGANAANANAHSDHFKVGEEGHITLTQQTMVSNATLPPGDYEVRHRRSATGHFVEFTRVVANYTTPQQKLSPYDWVVAAKVPCTMRPLNAIVTRTSLDTSKGAAAHIIGLEIRGENVEHVFQPGPDPSASQNQVEYWGGGGM